MPQTIDQLLQNKKPKIKRIKLPKLVNKKFSRITEKTKKSSSIIPTKILEWLEINPKSRPLDIQRGVGFQNIKSYLKILVQENQIKKHKIGQLTVYSKN